MVNFSGYYLYCRKIHMIEIKILHIGQHVSLFISNLDNQI